MIQQHPGLYYASSGKHHRGVFCAQDIEAGSVIEICPVIVIPYPEARMIVRGHVLYDYYFDWQEKGVSIALGFGSLYNHSTKPNADFECEWENELIIFKAILKIEAGSEILIHYHAGVPEFDVWFEAK
jgi:SET domain-containing protein